MDLFKKIEKLEEENRILRKFNDEKDKYRCEKIKDISGSYIQPPMLEVYREENGVKKRIKINRVESSSLNILRIYILDNI